MKAGNRETDIRRPGEPCSKRRLPAPTSPVRSLLCHHRRPPAAPATSANHAGQHDRRQAGVASWTAPRPAAECRVGGATVAQPGPHRTPSAAGHPGHRMFPRTFAVKAVSSRTSSRRAAPSTSPLPSWHRAIASEVEDTYAWMERIARGCRAHVGIASIAAKRTLSTRARMVRCEKPLGRARSSRPRRELVEAHDMNRDPPARIRRQARAPRLALSVL